MALAEDKANLLAAHCLPLLFDPEWIIRRKHRVVFVEPGLIRHHVTLDLDIPARACKVGNNYWLPLTTLPKAPGTLFCFDFCDARGTSIPLRSREDNAQFSVALLLAELAKSLRTIPTSLTQFGLASQPDVIKSLRTEVSDIAWGDSQEGQSLIKSNWMAPPAPCWWAAIWHQVMRRKTGQGKYSSETNAIGIANNVRDQLRTSKGHFWWLLNTVSHSSFLVAPVTGDIGDRVILKLAYDEIIDDVTDGWTANLKRAVRAASYRSGCRALPITFYIPWAISSSFHFEAHVPPGLAVARAGTLARGMFDTDRTSHSHVHIYSPPGAAARIQKHAINYRLAADEYGVIAYGVTALVTVLFGLAACHPEYLWIASYNHATKQHTMTSIGPVSSILLLIPGLVVTYLARDRHPAARRLSGLARLCLLSVALSAFVIAARLAVISPNHATTVDTLRYDWLVPAAAVTATATIILTLRRISWRVGLLVVPWTTRARRVIAKRRMTQLR